MVIKQLSFLVCCIAGLSFNVLYSNKLETTRYEPVAKEWLNAYIETPQKKLRISKVDLQLLANLLYFSYLRSQITLQAQEIAQKTLTTVWNGNQNICQTRMNPSRKTPYSIDLEIQKKLFEQFLQAEYLHNVIGKTYALCAQAVVKENTLTTSYAQDAVTSLREKARNQVVQSVLDVKNILGELYNYASAHVRQEAENPLEEPRTMMETVANYIPYFAYSSFIEAEKINTQASEQSWQVVTTIADVSKQVWHAIETARAGYYLAHYYALIQLMHDHTIEQKYFNIMFDDGGMIAPENQCAALPEISHNN